MNQLLNEIMKDILNQYDSNQYKRKTSKLVKNFTNITNEYDFLMDSHKVSTYYSTEHKKVVLGYFNNDQFMYFLFEMDKVDKDLKRLPIFEWYDRYIFTFDN